MIDPLEGGSRDRDHRADSAAPTSHYTAMPAPFDDLRLRMPAHASLEKLAILAADGEITVSADRRVVEQSDEAAYWCARAAAEVRVAAALSALGAEWTLLHSVAVTAAETVSHLAIGPSGVFVISTENRTGVTVAGAFSSRIDQAVRRVRSALAGASGVEVPVTGVIAVVGAHRLARRRRDDAIELHDHEVLDLLEGPDVLSADEVERVADAAVLRTTWSTRSHADTDTSWISTTLATPLADAAKAAALAGTRNRISAPQPGEVVAAPDLRPSTETDMAEPSRSDRPARVIRGENGNVAKTALVITGAALMLPLVGAVATGALTLLFGLVG